MHTIASIRTVAQIFCGRAIDLPEEPGVYAFWWVGDKADLMAADRHIVLKGPGERPVNVEYKDWWPPELAYPCLYVGKSTNIKKRFSLHIKRDCSGRLHRVLADNKKLKPCTTSCQLRYGIEHVFRAVADPLALIFRSVGFSYTTDFPTDAIAERFYAEDRLVGTWRPWSPAARHFLEFDALRSRADFEKLVEAVQAKAEEAGGGRPDAEGEEVNGDVYFAR